MAAGLGKLRQYQLTLNGSAQCLQTAIPNKSDGTFDATLADSFDGNPLCEWIDLQADDGNANVVAVGSDNTVTAANYGIQIPLPPSNVPAAPIRLEGPIRPKDIWVIGTNNQKLNVLMNVMAA